MSLIEFKDLPDTTTPLTADNLNNNFNELKPYVLYSNSTGSAGEITLSDSAENYSYIEVYGAASNTYTFQKIKNPNNKKFNINLSYPQSNLMIMLLSVYSITGNIISPVLANCGYSTISTSELCKFNSNNTNYFYITDVVGYK